MPESGKSHTEDSNVWWSRWPLITKNYVIDWTFPSWTWDINIVTNLQGQSFLITASSFGNYQTVPKYCHKFIYTFIPLLYTLNFVFHINKLCFNQNIVFLALWCIFTSTVHFNCSLLLKYFDCFDCNKLLQIIDYLNILNKVLLSYSSPTPSTSIF